MSADRGAAFAAAHDNRPVRTPARAPREVARLFQQYMRDGDIESVLTATQPFES